MAANVEGWSCVGDFPRFPFPENGRILTYVYLLRSILGHDLSGYFIVFKLNRYFDYNDITTVFHPLDMPCLIRWDPVTEQTVISFNDAWVHYQETGEGTWDNDTSNVDLYEKHWVEFFDSHDDCFSWNTINGVERDQDGKWIRPEGFEVIVLPVDPLHAKKND